MYTSQVLKKGVCLVVAVLVSLVAHQAKGQDKYQVGFFAPDLPLDAYEQYNYVQGLAKQMSQALGVPVKGVAYKNEKAFTQDLKTRKIQFAVLGAFYLAVNTPGTLLASGRISSNKFSKWTLMSKKRISLGHLRHKKLQLPNLGRLVLGLVQNGILGGNLVVKKYFNILRAPSLNSAVEAVFLEKTEVVFAPMSSKGLVPVLNHFIDVPGPGFLVVDKRLSQETVSKASKAVFSYGGKAGILVGWTAAKADIYRRLAAQSAKQTMRMVMLPAKGAQIAFDKFIKEQDVRYEFPELDDHFQIP